MYWENKGLIWIPNYEETTRNQYGPRYKSTGAISIPVAKLSIEVCEEDFDDLRQLVLIGDHIKIPLTYEFTKPQNQISIELVSAVRLREALK